MNHKNNIRMIAVIVSILLLSSLAYANDLDSLQFNSADDLIFDFLSTRDLGYEIISDGGKLR